eukprot:10632623-Lingulodinium_polyedra.AAC.1
MRVIAKVNSKRLICHFQRMPPRAPRHLEPVAVQQFGEPRARGFQEHNFGPTTANLVGFVVCHRQAPARYQVSRPVPRKPSFFRVRQDARRREGLGNIVPHRAIKQAPRIWKITLTKGSFEFLLCRGPDTVFACACVFRCSRATARASLPGDAMSTSSQMSS